MVRTAGSARAIGLCLREAIHVGHGPVEQGGGVDKNLREYYVRVFFRKRLTAARAASTRCLCVSNSKMEWRGYDCRNASRACSIVRAGVWDRAPRMKATSTAF